MNAEPILRFMGPEAADRFDVTALATGQKHRVAIELAEDGMGRAVLVPLLVARGKKPGPVFGLTAALHGNELNGIPVVHQLIRDLSIDRLAGTVVAVVVANVPGYLRRQRGYIDGQDLNHLFPGSPTGTTSQQYCWSLLQRVVRQFDSLVDLHTASFGRENSLYVRADMLNPKTASMAYRLAPQIILHNPPSDQTLRGAAQVLGKPSVTLEIGNPQRYHDGYIKAARVGIRALMADFGMVPPRKHADPVTPVLCSSSRWMYTERGGLLDVRPEVCDHVLAGDLVAEQVDSFGDPVGEYRAPFDGVVIGRSVDPVGYTGARILHLGSVAPEDHNFVPRTVPLP